MKRKHLMTEIERLREALNDATYKADKAERRRQETERQAKNREDNEELARRVVAVVGAERLWVVEGSLDVDQQWVDVTADYGAYRQTIPGQRTATLTLKVGGDEGVLLRLIDLLRTEMT